MKEWGCYSLEQAYQSMKDNSIMPIDLEQFAIRLNTIKPRISDVCSIEDLLLEVNYNVHLRNGVNKQNNILP